MQSKRRGQQERRRGMLHSLYMPKTCSLTYIIEQWGDVLLHTLHHPQCHHTISHSLLVILHPRNTHCRGGGSGFNIPPLLITVSCQRQGVRSQMHPDVNATPRYAGGSSRGSRDFIVETAHLG
jgi:hypothetical protein